jgi:hypothetical protein
MATAALTPYRGASHTERFEILGYQRAIGIYSQKKLKSLSWNNRRDLLVRLERGLVYQCPGEGEYHDGGAIGESE